MRFLRKVANELRCHLRIGIRPERNAAGGKFFSQRIKVEQRAIVCQRNNGLINRRKMRLSRLPSFGPGSPIATVPDRGFPRHGIKIRPGKDFGHQTKIFANQDSLTIADRYTS